MQVCREAVYLSQPGAVSHLLTDGNRVHVDYSLSHTDLSVYDFKMILIKLRLKFHCMVIKVNFSYLLPESFLQSLLWNEEEIFWFS